MNAVKYHVVGRGVFAETQSGKMVLVCVAEFSADVEETDSISYQEALRTAIVIARELNEQKPSVTEAG
jgi:hypothetical protein